MNFLELLQVEGPPNASSQQHFYPSLSRIRAPQTRCWVQQLDLDLFFAGGACLRRELITAAHTIHQDSSPASRTLPRPSFIMSSSAVRSYSVNWWLPDGNNGILAVASVQCSATAQALSISLGASVRLCVGEAVVALGILHPYSFLIDEGTAGCRTGMLFVANGSQPANRPPRLIAVLLGTDASVVDEHGPLNRAGAFSLLAAAGLVSGRDRPPAQGGTITPGIPEFLVREDGSTVAYCVL